MSIRNVQQHWRFFHDAPEIITGDLPTPVKYYNPSIHKAYQEVEKVAQEKLLSMLPQDLKARLYLFIISRTGRG